MNISRIRNKCGISHRTLETDDSYSFIFMDNIYEVFLFSKLDISVIKKNSCCF